MSTFRGVTLLPDSLLLHRTLSASVERQLTGAQLNESDDGKGPMSVAKARDANGVNQSYADHRLAAQVGKGGQDY